jgi:hypothetical protein
MIVRRGGVTRATRGYLTFYHYNLSPLQIASSRLTIYFYHGSTLSGSLLETVLDKV